MFYVSTSVETKIKTLFLMSHFNLSKKTRNDTLGTRIQCLMSNSRNLNFDFVYVVTKTDNDDKRPQTTSKRPANDHKPPANDHKPPLNNHRRPNKPFPSSNYLIFS